MGDRWTLELLLAAAPWISGNRTPEDKYLGDPDRRRRDGAEGLHRLPTTSPSSFPLPSRRGARRAAAGPMPKPACAPSSRRWSPTRTFYEAIPGLLDALPAGRCRRRSSGCGWRPTRRRSRRSRDVAAGLALDPRAACDPRSRRPSRSIARDEFMRACGRLAREFGVGLHSHVGEIKVQAMVGMQALRQDADRASGRARPARAGFHRGAWRLARRRRLPAPGRPRRLRRAQPGQQHAARQRASPTCAACSTPASMSASAPTARPAPTTRTCTRRCASPPSSRRCRGPTRAGCATRRGA